MDRTATPAIGVHVHLQFPDEGLLDGAGKSDGDEGEVRLDDEFGALDRRTFFIDTGAFDPGQAAVLAYEFERCRCELAIGPFGLRGRGAHLGGPIRPLRQLVLDLGRLRANIHLGDFGRPLAEGGADAVGCGITATDNHDALAAGPNLGRWPAGTVYRFGTNPAVLLNQIGHGRMHPDQIRARDAGIARIFRARGNQDGIEFLQEILRLLVLAHVYVAVENHALGCHLLDAAVDVVFFHLEVRNAIAHQAAWAAFAFEDMNLVADARELLGCSHASRTGADHGHLLARLLLRWLRTDQAKLESPVGDCLLDGLDGNGNVFQVERARFLAGCGADAAGKLRKVVGGVQIAHCLFPVAIVDQVVPVRDLVVHRTAGIAMAIGNAAIHAAGGLLGHLVIGHRQGEFAVVANTVGSRLVLGRLPVDFEKSRYFTHVSITPLPRRRSACLPFP